MPPQLKQQPEFPVTTVPRFNLQSVNGDKTIRVEKYLRDVGVSVDTAQWFSSPERPTHHVCSRVVENPNAVHGEPFRMEVYQDMNNPGNCFYVLYRYQRSAQTGEMVVTNQFVSNDPEYVARHEWLRPIVDENAFDEIREDVHHAVLHRFLND